MEWEEAGAFSIPLKDREEVAGAIVGLTMGNGFQRQVDCILRSRKIKLVSTTAQESARKATSEGTKRRETKERQLRQPARPPQSGRRVAFTTLSDQISEHPVQGAVKACGPLKHIKRWKMLPGKSDMMRLKPA